MTTPDDGGPAFPEVQSIEVYGGLSKREWFAGHALTGILAQSGRTGTFAGYAADACALADAMLIELAKERKP